MDATRLPNIGWIAAGAASFFLIVGMAQASFSGESVMDRLERLDTDYHNQIEIINRADEVIEKQYDIKMRAEASLKSTTIDLANVKIQLEMAKEDPDMKEINRLSSKVANYAAELGL